MMGCAWTVQLGIAAVLLQVYHNLTPVTPRHSYPVDFSNVPTYYAFKMLHSCVICIKSGWARNCKMNIYGTQKLMNKQTKWT